jgi:hypothetical protein
MYSILPYLEAGHEIPVDFMELAVPLLHATPAVTSKEFINKTRTTIGISSCSNL